MASIPTFKAPSPSSFAGSLPSVGGSNLPKLPSIALNPPVNIPSVGNLSKMPSVGGLGGGIPSMGGLSTGLPDGIPLKNAVPNFSAPSMPSDIFSGTKTKVQESLPKFDSKLDIPEIQTGKLGLLSSPVDLGEFKEKSMSRLDSIVPEFSPDTKISALNAISEKKSALLDAAKSAAGGALAGVAGGIAGALASGQSLKNAAGSIAKSAIGGAIGSAVGNIASKTGVGGQIAGAIGGAAGTLAAGGNLKQAAGSLVGGIAGNLAGNAAGKLGIPSNVAGALGSAAGTLAAGGKLKQAVGGAAGNLVASTVAGKLGGGVVGAAVGTVAGAKISGASTKSSLVGGLTAGAGAFALSKIMAAPAVVKATPSSGAISVPSQENIQIPKDVNIVTSANSEPSVPVSKSVPPASPTATIDSETGKVTLSNTSAANTTTIKETVIGGGSKTTYADRYNPATNKYEPVPDKIEPPTKTETVTVVNNKTGEVLSSTQTTEEITKQEAQKQATQAKVNTPKPVEYTSPPPIKVKRPINPLFTLQTDSAGNEYLLISPESISIIPVGLEIVSMSGTKDILTIVYADGSKKEAYTAKYSIEKYGFGNSSGDSVAVDTLPNGKTSTYLHLAMSEDYSLPENGDSPYFKKNSDGSISYTFSDGSTATELPSGTKSLFTIKDISAEVEMPTKVSPSSLEMPADQLEKSKLARKKIYLENKYNVGSSYDKQSDGGYNLYTKKERTDSSGNILYVEKKDYFFQFRRPVKTYTEREKLPNVSYLPAYERVLEKTISKEEVDADFEKQWNEKFKNEATQSFAKKLAEKYEKLNRDDQVKTAESADKGHVIEVVRTGYSAKGDSYKVKSVRLYKKTEEVTK